jgi:hypothetical protein
MRSPAANDCAPPQDGGAGLGTGLAVAKNGCAERPTGSIRRQCVDHFVILGEAHLRECPDRFSGTELSSHLRSLADCITITPGFRCSVHTPGALRRLDGRKKTNKTKHNLKSTLAASKQSRIK